MNFLAIPTLKNVRACFLRPISMMPRFSLKLTLARLRTGIESAGSLLRCAAVMTTSATPTRFFSTAPLFFSFFCGMSLSYLLTTFCACSGRFKAQSHLLRVLRLNFHRILLVRHFRLGWLRSFGRFCLALGTCGRRGYVHV